MQKTAQKNRWYSKTGSILKLAKKWLQCKGYSPCKILSLGQKIKLPKTCEKRLHKHIKVVLCKKRFQITAYILKMEAFLKKAKNGHSVKAIAHAKYSVWVKN